jgi:NAD(P)-dependent dehydrogenase (short-subunit alcohol dehydrogenase family)
LGPEARWLRIDVADPASISAGMERVLAESERVDGLVNSAGLTVVGNLLDLELKDYERLMAVNVRGAWLCSRALLPAMIEQRGGTIVNVSSFHARAADPTFGLYAASKAALVSLTRGIAADFGRFGIRCNSVSPGWVPSETSLRNDAEAINTHLRSRQMLPQAVTPDDVGAAVAFLSGPESGAITAIDLAVDGGTSAMLRHRASPDEPLP